MPYHDPTGDLMAYRQFCLIADKIEADPALLEIPLANIRDGWPTATGPNGNSGNGRRGLKKPA